MDQRQHTDPLAVIGGLACIYTGVRGIIEATGIDGLITALSWGVAVTGVVLVLGASLARRHASRRPAMVPADCATRTAQVEPVTSPEAA